MKKLFIIFALLLAYSTAFADIQISQRAAAENVYTHTFAGAPTATDDSGDGYLDSVLWIWNDTANNDIYVLSDDTAGAAIWVRQNMPRGTAGQICVTTGATSDCELSDTFSLSITKPSATDADAHTITSTEARGYQLWATGAGQWDLPAAVQGMNFCLYSTTAAAVVINPANDDVIVLNGAALSAGDSITSASGAGDYICLVARDGTNWHTTHRSGNWTDTN